MNDLTNLIEWTEFVADGKTVLEVLTILNNRHLKAVDKIERERDEAREQIAASAINTNVRLFDLVRYSRASLYEDELITDEEYAWLCGGAEMANSPKGGSPSPRRLEDYDEIRKQLEAMRATMTATEAYQAGLAADNEAMSEAIKLASVALDMADDEVYPPQANCSCHISPPCNDCVDHSQARETKDFIKRALAKLKPFLKP